MSRVTISTEDAACALEVAALAGRAGDTSPFSEDVVELLRRLFAAERAGYVEYAIGAPPNVYDVETPRLDVPPSFWQSVGEVLPTWPLRDRLGRKRHTFKAISDTLTRTQRRRNPFHRTVSAPLGVEEELKIWLPAPLGEARLFWFCRSRTQRDFQQREHDLATLLTPWLARQREQWDERRAPAQLTAREAEVLTLVRQGLTNREIGKDLHISPGTVRKHLDHIYEKLGVHSRTAAAVATIALLNL